MLKALFLIGSLLPAVGGKILQPPAKYQGDNAVQVEFLSISDVAKKCRSLNGDKGAKACASVELMTLPFACDRGGTYAELVCKTLADKSSYVTFSGTLPNPCHFVNGGTYADLMCHELGHVNGWHPTHPKR